MKRKHKRLLIVGLGLGALGLAAALILLAFDDSLVFFYSPSDLATKHVSPSQRIRVGGLVEQGSLVKEPDGLTYKFVVTDLKQKLPVTYKGVLPDLFREGQGVVAEGRLDPGGGFVADDVLAKHDENYMPREVADALKKSGEWKRQGAEAK